MWNEFRAALHATSVVCVVVSALMLLPAMADAAAGHPAWSSFLQAALLSSAGWTLIAVATRGDTVIFSPRFGIILVNMLWWLLPVGTIAPLMMGPAQLSLADAIFESASGFTTTGSTVLSGLDSFDPGTLVWRSLIQWFGGIGILSLGLIVLPFLNAGGLQLFRLESSDRSEKVMPRFASIVQSIVVVYVMLTGLCAAGYYLSGMSAFDAVNHAMTTLSTGGFSTHDKSMGYFQADTTLWIGALFMAMGGVPFTLYVAIVFMRQKPGFDPQILWYFLIIGAAVALLLLGRGGDAPHSPRSIAEDVFDVISIITTTGYAAGDYTTWGSLAAPLFFMLTFFGGCAGSTAGGLKIYRLIVLTQMVRGALRQLINPHGVFPVRYGRRRVDPEIFESALVMSVAFAGVLAVSTLVMGALGHDLVTSISGAVTALANVGPGLGEVIGPSSTFAALTADTKLFLAALMVAGRVEIMVVLALLMPAMWR